MKFGERDARIPSWTGERVGGKCQSVFCTSTHHHDDDDDDDDDDGRWKRASRQGICGGIPGTMAKRDLDILRLVATTSSRS